MLLIPILENAVNRLLYSCHFIDPYLGIFLTSTSKNPNVGSLPIAFGRKVLFLAVAAKFVASGPRHLVARL